MIINGSKYLNKNNYNRIILDLLKNDCNDCYVKVKCEKDYPTIKEDSLFMNDLKKLNDDEKAMAIVDHYLRNNKIKSLIEDERIIGYSGVFAVAHSRNNQLALKLKNDELGKNIIKKVLKRYYYDRYDYCFNNVIKRICFSTRMESYGNNTLTLLTLYVDNDFYLTKDNAQFLKELILNKLDYENKAYIKYFKCSDDNCYVPIFKKFLICGNLKIRLEENIIDRYVSEIISEYNCELECRKVMQLKLKGWDDCAKNI